MEKIESRATERNITNFAGNDLSTIKTEIDFNKVKIESEAKISEERFICHELDSVT